MKFIGLMVMLLLVAIVGSAAFAQGNAAHIETAKQQHVQKRFALTSDASAKLNQKYEDCKKACERAKHRGACEKVYLMKSECVAKSWMHQHQCPYRKDATDQTYPTKTKQSIVEKGRAHGHDAR